MLNRAKSQSSLHLPDQLAAESLTQFLFLMVYYSFLGSLTHCMALVDKKTVNNARKIMMESGSGMSWISKTDSLSYGERRKLDMQEI